MWPIAANNSTDLISETQRSAGSAFPAASVLNTLSTAHQQTSKPHPPKITLLRADTHPLSFRPGESLAAWAQLVPETAEALLSKSLLKGEVKTVTLGVN